VQSRVIHRDVVKPVDTGELDGEGVARGEGWVCYGQLARTIYTSKRNICPEILKVYILMKKSTLLVKYLA